MMPQQAVTDETILAKLRDDATKEEAFRLLMQAYSERLYWHIRRMVTEHADANDVLQEVFIKVWKYHGNFRGNSQLYTWLYRIATNETLSFLSARKKHTHFSVDDEELNLEHELTADRYFDGDEAQRKLQQAIRLLPDKQKLVFNMRYYDEMKYEEMSEILETSIGALKASYHHAVKKIEKYLTGE